MTQTLREIGRAVQLLGSKVDDFLSGVRNRGETDSAFEHENSLRPLLRSFSASLIVDAPPEACVNLYAAVSWNVTQGRIPEDFLSCQDFVEQRQFIEHEFCNCYVRDVINRVRIFDDTSPWCTVSRQIYKQLPDDCKIVLSFFGESE